MNTLTVTPIKNNNNLLNTINSHIKLRKLKEKHLKVRKADALKQIGANIKEEENKNCSSLYYSNSNSDTATRKIRIKACAQLIKRQRLELEAQLRKVSKEEDLLDSNDYYLDSSLDINPKDNLEDEEATIAKNLKNKIVAIDPANSTLYNLSDPLVVRFYIFSNSALENIGIPTNKKVVEMQTNTATTLANKLAAINKLIILEANTPTMHSKATKHYLALLAAQFIIVCSFRKVDKYIFRAYNTISVTAQRTIIRKSSSYIEKRFNATNKRDSVTSDCIYKIEDARNIITNIKHDASEHKLSYKDILEKEGLNKLEASRRVIFNCFEISCKVKRFTLNSVKNLFTNLSKDYFLVQEARAITKSSLNIVAEDAAKAANILLLLKEVCAKILIESYKLIVQAIIVALIAFAEAIILTEATHVVIIELQDSIIYFNLDSELKLKVLSKQDVKITF
ncbi:hypothetical protein HBI06_249770 [Parastagonospora nodorum]|nr:hypothetical protein HBI06_249770 [Parastagonospora nodorum]KAH4223070.1 hypothetical protein HBI05_250150 [Parastagonospora nodorum]